LSVDDSAMDEITPAISVVLPVYNGEKYIAEAMESILCQTFRDFELIVIDDGSSDGTLAILREYQVKDSRIHLTSRRNKGLIATLNEGIDFARGAWIARMDSDDIALPHRFERQLQWLERTGADMTGSWVKFFGSWDRRVWKGYQSDQAIKLDMLFKSPFVHPSVMMRADLIKQLRYDKNCEKAEDYDLWVRAAQAGWKMSNVPEVLLQYRKHDSQVSIKSSSKQQLVSESVRRRYWESITGRLKLEPAAAEEVFKLSSPSPTSVDMNMADSVLLEFLFQSKDEARQAVLDNISRFYLRVSADQSDVGARWARINKKYGSGFALGTRFKLWVVKCFHISYGGNLFKQAKKISSFFIR
jgi:glycosyltransferase involved in cell wall biosynthesis